MATPQLDPQAKPKLAVQISYNGMNASFDYEPEQLAKHIRSKALDQYEIHGQARHEEFLFGPDNQTEINDEATMGSQVTAGSQLYLRRRSQGGGASR